MHCYFYQTSLFKNKHETVLIRIKKESFEHIVLREKRWRVFAIFISCEADLPVTLGNFMVNYTDLGRETIYN